MTACVPSLTISRLRSGSVCGPGRASSCRSVAVTTPRREGAVVVDERAKDLNRERAPTIASRHRPAHPPRTHRGARRTSVSRSRCGPPLYSPASHSWLALVSGVGTSCVPITVTRNARRRSEDRCHGETRHRADLAKRSGGRRGPERRGEEARFPAPRRQRRRGTAPVDGAPHTGAPALTRTSDHAFWTPARDRR